MNPYDLFHLLRKLKSQRKSPFALLRAGAPSVSRPFAGISVRIGLLCLFLAPIFVQIGCATQKAVTQPSEPPSPVVQSAKDAYDLLLRSCDNADSLKASGKIQMKFPGEEHRRQASIMMMMQRPNKLRMRAYRPLSPPLFEFASDGNECWLYIPSRRSAYWSKGCEPFRIDGGNTTISAEIIIASLFVLIDPESLSLQPEITTNDSQIGIELIDDTGGRREIWIDPATGLAARQVLADPDGSVRADLRYMEYSRESGAAVPTRIEAAMPEIGAELTVWISQVEINAEIPENAFLFFPPEGSVIPSEGE